MAKIKLFNSLSNKKDIFRPINQGKVGMYTCGPTVYGPGHLGHARTYTSFDLLKRMFLYNGYQVNHVLNITDIHDDMINQAIKLNLTVEDLADKYIPLFKRDLSDLNILPADVYPRVTEHINEIVEMVKILVEKGYAYVQKDGSVYFDIDKFKDYGQLSGVKSDQLKTGTRVASDKYDKENVSDFALWKGHKPGEPYWQSPWGKGRPGWHIECSVMAERYLGDTIDIHAGAMDLKFPHHENEIAQFEAAKDQQFVNYWIHAGLLSVEGKKMSKSLGNYLELKDIVNKGFQPLSLRYHFLTSHYRSKMNFTWQGLESSQVALNKLRRRLKVDKINKLAIASSKAKKYHQKFLSFINDNLAIPQALALAWEIIDSDLAREERLGLIFDFDRVFGLNLAQNRGAEVIPDKIIQLAEKRERLRQEEKWDEADQVRIEIEKLGFSVEDREGSYKIVNKHKLLDESGLN